MKEKKFKNKNIQRYENKSIWKSIIQRGIVTI